MERTGHHCPIHKEPSLPVLFRKYRSQEEYGKGIAGIPHLFKKSSQPLPLLIADLKEEIIDEYLNREGLQEIKKMLYHPGYIPNTELPAVYSGASVFIYTSLRESFGIPIGGDGLWNSRHHLNHFRHARNRRTGGYSRQSVRTGGNCFRPPSFRRKCRILSVTNCIWTRKSPSVLMGEHSQRNIEYI